VSLYNEAMRLALGILLAIAGTAQAARATPDRCQPLAPTVLPSDGANVPLNTKVWQLGSKEGFYEYRKWGNGEKSITVQGELFDRNEDHPALRYPLHDLEPNHMYQLDGSGAGLSFETTAEVDTTPPATPIVMGVEILLEYQPLERMPISVLRFHANTSADTALLQIVVEDRIGRYTVTTTPQRTNICLPGIRLAPGSVDVSVFALDLAGNRSEGFGHHVHVADPTSPDPAGHVRCGIGSMGVILFGPVLLAGLLLGILLVLSLRHWRNQHGEGEAVSLLVADHIARAIARRAASGSVAALAAFISAWIFGHGLLVLLVGLIACVPLSTLLASRRVVRELEADRARAELRDTVLIVRSAQGQARLATSTRLIDEARRNAVPTSVARG
jgi:hypothetical protein